MVDLTSISAMLAAVGVTVGVVFAILELRTLTKTRQTDMIIRLYATFSSREFQEAWVNRANWESKSLNDMVNRSSRDAKVRYEAWVSFGSVAAFFEGIGVLLRRRLIDIALVDDLLSSPIKIAWESMKHLIESQREHWKLPQIWEWFEYLYNEMQKREQRP